MFAFTVVPHKRYRIKEAYNVDMKRRFNLVKGVKEMKQRELDKKEMRIAAVTQEDVDLVLAESIEQRVIPYGHHSYEEQLKLKYDDLKQILDTFGTNLNKDI